MPEFTWRPAHDATSDELEAVFDTGGARRCRCQALKVPGWIWRDTTQEERDAALLEQAGCGTGGPTSGLVGYVDGVPAGWVAVEPRESYPRIWARQKAWMRMDPVLEGVWSVTCFVVRPGFRRQGLMYELAAATVEYGRQVGARVLEGYPTEPPPGKTVIWDEASVGLLQVFLDAGYELEASPTLRRRVVRLRPASVSGPAMTRGCKIGVQLPEVERFVPWPEYLDLARRVEACGFDSVWVGDHLLYDLPQGSTRGPYEAWTTLAAIAAVTEQVEIGPLVASTSFHAPAMLAKQAATVDAISQGRLILGLGAGWNRREYDAFGFAYDRRVSRFEEAMAIIVPLLRTGRATFHGEFYDVEDCVLDPRPVREGGPSIMLGSTGPRMLGIGLPVVDAWNVWWSRYDNSVERFREVKAEVDAVTPEGRHVEATAAVLVTLPGATGRVMGDAYDAKVRTVTPDGLGEHVRGLTQAGASHLQLVLDPITAESIEVVGEAVADIED